MKITRITLFTAILIILAFLGSKYVLLTSLINNAPEKEVVLSEKSINLKGVSDPKRIAYETDNAIIKISNNAAKEYSLNQIKYIIKKI